MWLQITDHGHSLTWTCLPSVYVSVFSTVSVACFLMASRTIAALQGLVRKCSILPYGSLTVPGSIAGQMNWSNVLPGGLGPSAEHHRSLQELSRLFTFHKLLTCLCWGCSSVAVQDCWPLDIERQGHNHHPHHPPMYSATPIRPGHIAK